jgi:hypothetical protein
MYQIYAVVLLKILLVLQHQAEQRNHNSKGQIKDREYQRVNKKWKIQRNIRCRQTKQKHNTMFVGDRYAQINTNNVTKT